MVNPYSAYKKSSVSTMTPVEVVIKLYAEIERQLAELDEILKTPERTLDDIILHIRLLKEYKLFL